MRMGVSQEEAHTLSSVCEYMHGITVKREMSAKIFKAIEIVNYVLVERRENKKKKKQCVC